MDEKAHVEMETDKVTQSRVALTEREMVYLLLQYLPSLPATSYVCVFPFSFL